jgi:hypothetical protein
MKMVKSLLLGSAAGVVAVAGAQAADLPVKAKPVEYVKICSLYGDGFYYIPGSDICIKFSGYARGDYGYNNTGSRTPQYTGAPGAQDRTVNAFSTRHRAHFEVDTRTQTQYGTLRTFYAMHFDNQDQGTVTINVSRAFIQWAGFTFGRNKSYTDTPGTMGDDGFKMLHQNQNHSDSGSNGTNQIAYTWEWGNGVTTSIGADERRFKPFTNLSATSATIGTNTTGSEHGEMYPNPWALVNVNQAWGRAQVSVIGNPIHATYYSAPTPGFACLQPNTTQCGYPEDKWGVAVLGGIDIKAPFLAPGDHFGGYFAWGTGASAYAGGSNLNSPGLYGGNNAISFGWITDAVYVNGGAFELTSVFTFGAGYEHFWAPNFSSTLMYTHSKVSYNDTVINSRLFCGGGGAIAQGFTVAAAVRCDPGFGYWLVGSHTDWYPVPGFRLAVELLYVGIETAFKDQQVTISKTQGARPTGVYTAKDQGILSAVFRAQRSFPASGAE